MSSTSTAKSTSSHQHSASTKKPSAQPLSREARKALVEASMKAKKDATPVVEPIVEPTATSAADVAADDAAVAAAVGPKEEPKSGATRAWEDLTAWPTGIKPYKRPSVFATAMDCLTASEDGATLEEIKQAYKDAGHGHHDPKAGLVYANKNRGYGFVMNPMTQKIRVLPSK